MLVERIIVVIFLCEGRLEIIGSHPSEIGLPSLSLLLDIPKQLSLQRLGLLFHLLLPDLLSECQLIVLVCQTEFRCISAAEFALLEQLLQNSDSSCGLNRPLVSILLLKYLHGRHTHKWVSCNTS